MWTPIPNSPSKPHDPCKCSVTWMWYSMFPSPQAILILFPGYLKRVLLLSLWWVSQPCHNSLSPPATTLKLITTTFHILLTIIREHKKKTGLLAFPFTQWVTLSLSHIGNCRKDDNLNIDCINKQPNGEIGHSSYYACQSNLSPNTITGAPETIADDIHLHFHPLGLITDDLFF